MSIFDRFKSSRALKTIQEPKAPQAETAIASSVTDTLRANIEEDKKQFPEDSQYIDQFFRLICQTPAESNRELHSSQEEDSDADNASVQIFLTEDRMSAYACIFPPKEKGRHITVESVMEELRYEGLSYGISDRYLSYIVQEKKYLHIFPLARGTSPIDGEDGVITYYYEDKGPIDLTVPEGTAPDFEEEHLFQPVRKGEIICRFKLPTKSTDGMDVTGRVLKGYDGAELIIPRGKNTLVSNDGLLLTSSVDGIVYTQDGKYCVEKKKVIQENIGSSFGVLDYAGDVLIRGNVSGGATIRAKGDVIVEGTVTEAYITSSGIIRLQKGVMGSGKSIIKAASQIQSRTIEEANVEAEGDVYTEVILNSRLTSGGSIYVNTGRGMVAGGEIKTLNSIYAKKIGNLSDCLTRITLGHHSQLDHDIQNVENELATLRATLEKLRKNVSTMKALPNMSAEKKTILLQLTEQRNLYMERESELSDRLKELKRSSYSGSNTRIISEEVHPTTEVYLSGKKLVVQSLQTNCNIHLQGGELVLF